MTRSEIVQSFKARQAAIAKERDKLRDLQYELEGLIDDCDEAIDGLDAAIEALSRLQ